MSKGGQVKTSKVDKRIVTKVRRTLRMQKGHWKEIERQANGKLTYRWISAFAAGEISDPSFTRLAVLARCLGINIGVIEPLVVDEKQEPAQSQEAA